MSAISISSPFPTFTDVDGDPLESGYIYVGQANVDPVTFPIAVYWDAALTIPAAQPIRTIGGYPARNGSPARIYANSDYSIRVTNKNGSLVYSAPAATDRFSGVVVDVDATDVAYTPAGTGAVATTVQQVLRETVSVFRFMTPAQIADVQTGTPALDLTAAFTAADTYAASVNATLVFPYGTYLVGTVSATASWDGDGVIRATRINVRNDNLTFSRLSFYSEGLTLFSVGASATPNPSFQSIDIAFNPALGGARKAIYVENVDGLRVNSCNIETGGIELISATNFNISDNIFNRQWVAGAVEAVHASVKSYGVISGNTVLNSANDAFDLYSSGERTVVANNRLIGFRNCAAIEAKVIIRDDGQSSGDPGYGYAESLIISGNIIKDFEFTANAESAGIYAEYLDLRASPSLPVDRANAGIIISNNVIENAYVVNNPALSVQFFGIEYGGTNAVISNNILRNIYSWNPSGGVYSYGISLAQNTLSTAQTVRGVTITGNLITTDSGGIRFGRSTQVVGFYNIVVANNQIRSDYRPGTSVQRCIAIESGASIYNSTFSENIFETNNAIRRQGFFFAAASPVFTYNIVSKNHFYGSTSNFKTASYCVFSENMFDCIGYSQNPLTIGVSGTNSNGNRVLGNTLKQADTVVGAIDLYQQVGFGVSHNAFQDASLPIRVFSTSTSGLITENISISGGATFVTYSGSAPVTESNNLIV